MQAELPYVNRLLLKELEAQLSRKIAGEMMLLMPQASSHYQITAIVATLAKLGLVLKEVDRLLTLNFLLAVSSLTKP